MYIEKNITLRNMLQLKNTLYFTVTEQAFKVIYVAFVYLFMYLLIYQSFDVYLNLSVNHFKRSFINKLLNHLISVEPLSLIPT